MYERVLGKNFMLKSSIPPVVFTAAKCKVFARNERKGNPERKSQNRAKWGS